MVLRSRVNPLRIDTETKARTKGRAPINAIDVLTTHSLLSCESYTSTLAG